MNFITQDEFISIVCPPGWFKVIGGNGGADFDAANTSTTSLICRIAGIDAPDGATVVAAELKMYAAWIIMYVLSTPSRQANIPQEHLDENRARYDEAINYLKSIRAKPLHDTRTASASFNEMWDY